MNATSKKFLFSAIVITLVLVGLLFLNSKETVAVNTKTTASENRTEELLPVFEKQSRTVASTKGLASDDDLINDIEDEEQIKDETFETSPELVETVTEQVEEEKSITNNVDMDLVTDKVAVVPDVPVKSVQLHPAPFSKTKELFVFSEESRKYPVRLKWSNVKGADRYEIEISRGDKASRKYFRALKNKFDIMIFSDKSYSWRVVAYQNETVITEYSPLYPLRVELQQINNFVSEIEPEQIETVVDEEESEVSEYSELSRLDESENNTFPGFEKLPELDHEKRSKETTQRAPASSGSKMSIWGGFWAWLGVGGNAIDYQQKINETAGLDYNTIQNPSYSGAFGSFISDKVALELTGGASAGRFNERGGLFDEDYVWTTYGLEALYLLGAGKKSSKDSSWYLRFGGKYHDLPILEAYPLTRDVNLLSNNILGVSIGIGKRTLHSKRFRSEFYLNYQQPLSAVTEESDYKLLGSTFVNSYLGLNYQIYGSYHLGLFWQGQYYDGEYSLSNGFESVEGRQILINNKLGVFLGLDF